MSGLKKFKFYRKNNELRILDRSILSKIILLSWVWLFYQKFFLFGFILFSCELLIFLLVIPESIYLCFSLLIGLRLIASWKSESLIEKKLCSYGFRLEESIEAADKKRAMAQYNNLRSHIIEY
jgi:hypothetical protein|tara:strand:- start:7660 stop:8028 length:369 start_codon:yes stop_codon:yes gene_type:complete